MFVWASSAATGAAAQTAAVPASSEATYQEAVRAGVEEYELEHWNEARAYFERAHTILPNARTLRALALVAFQLRDYVETIERGEAALASVVRPLDAADRSELEGQLGRARQFVARIAVTCKPADASLRLDGRPVTPDEAGSLLLNPGPHELTAERAGSAPVTRALQAHSGEDLRLDFVLGEPATARDLVPPPTSAAISTPTARTQSDPGPGSVEPPGGRGGAGPWLVVAASGAAVVTGGIVLALALGDVASVEDAKKGSAWADVKDESERAPTLSAIGWSLLGAGVVGAGVGLWWMLGDGDERAAGATLAAWPGGARLAGRF